MASELMPGGKPRYLDVIHFPMIRDLVKSEGKKKMLAVLVIMVKDLCSSLNVVRNMNEDQMIEAAAMLLDECGNFRLEDYVMMFSMGKRGQLVKIYDRIDLQVITAMMDEYWEKRKAIGDLLQENEVNHYDIQLGENPIDKQNIVWIDGKGFVEQKTDESKIATMAGLISDISKNLRQAVIAGDDTEAKNQIVINPNYKNNYKPQ